MSTVEAVGLVVYTYDVLEERLDAIWAWFQAVEAWAGHVFTEYGFSPREKQSLRIWKATQKNRANLLERLRTEQPWIEALRRTDALRRRLPEFESRAYQAGLDTLQACACSETSSPLAREGLLLTLSDSPLTWEAPAVQQWRARLDQALATIGLARD